jgi:nicotinamide riboside kinase
VFANQHRGIAECYGKVDYIIIDSPVLFSTIYHTYYTKGYPAEFYGQPFHDLVVDLHKRYDNLNILLERTDGAHNEDERFQDYEESIAIDKLCKEILDKHDIPYYTIKVGKHTVKEILKLL